LTLPITLSTRDFQFFPAKLGKAASKKLAYIVSRVEPELVQGFFRH
jgi:hypothetical protein